MSNEAIVDFVVPPQEIFGVAAPVKPPVPAPELAGLLFPDGGFGAGQCHKRRRGKTDVEVCKAP